MNELGRLEDLPQDYRDELAALPFHALVDANGHWLSESAMVTMMLHGYQVLQVHQELAFTSREVLTRADSVAPWCDMVFAIRFRQHRFTS